MKKIKKKKILKRKSLLFLLCLILLFSIGGTIAYYYETVYIPNQFKTMTYDVELTEEFNNEWGTKKVYITNNESSNTSVVIRIGINELWSKEVDDVLLTLSNTLNGSNVVNKVFTNTFNNDFVNGNDGWYYYKKILRPNESIQILDSISLNTNLIQNTPYYDDYLSYNYNLNFNYEALEAKVDTILEIWNKNVSINSINVSWN